jgi:choline dehydrogenase-like flavoprotein
VRVSENRSRYRTGEAFIEAGLEAGLPPNEDFNGPEQDGVGWYQVTQRGGLRCSAKLIVIALVSFFPVVVTTLAGLEGVDPDLRS